MTHCAIDFGTSNSAVALPARAFRPVGSGAATPPADGAGVPAGGVVRLVPLEGQAVTLPTAVFFDADNNRIDYGRAAVASYIDGIDGRLMRSMKSILGSDLIERTTDIGGGRGIPYIGVIATFLRHLKAKAEAAAGKPLTQVVLGRPAFFVDDDPERDIAAQTALAAAARSVGFKEVAFQFEPIAAAFDHESRLDHEQLVLVADIGGGTSDFSLVRVGPERAKRLDRRDDILGHHGVHVAGTDFDRRVALASVLRPLGHGSVGPDGKPVPSGVYFDLATWHLINTLYTPRRIADLAGTKHLYADRAQHARLMRVLEDQLGHGLLGIAEDTKIAVAAGGSTRVDLSLIERELALDFDEAGLVQAVDDEIARIVGAATETARLAGVGTDEIDAVYFTGGSTGLRLLTERIRAGFPKAQAVTGDRFASVAVGLGIHAGRLFGG
ncbi:Hsp70 family protein [Derxia gummosa]|uniref:Hsp70 family protein n=1 Tax=Derxia gummosa DSM 723 TaxID=1121388 RepID=A0A8B6X505_9BURK|nr:Hsp70 family protein [Derxia gummosa]